MPAQPRVVQLPAFSESNGLLVVPSAIHEGFSLKRVFFVRGNAGDIRGQHAHRRCSQLLVCVAGAVRVLTDNGADELAHQLHEPTAGVLVPPMVWCEQEYQADGTVLLVLCDQDFDEDDYIRDPYVFQSLL